MARLSDGVIKRGSTWAYVIRVRNPATGVSKPRWVGGFRTEDEAKAARDGARVRARRGEYVDRSRITVAEYLDRWLETHAMAIRPRTLASYRYLVEEYIKPALGEMPLQALQPATISKLYLDLHTTGGRRGEGLSARSVAYVHAVLRKAFNDAVHIDRLLTKNPAESAKRPLRERQQRTPVWNPGELRSFLAAASEHRYSAFYATAAFTGARRGELLHLRWTDLDLDVRTMHLRGSAGVIDGQWVDGPTKGGDHRSISLDAGTVALLRDLREEQQAKRQTAADSWEGWDKYVFTTDLGKRIHPDSVSQAMPRLIASANAARAAAGLEPLAHARLHDLRHIHATTLLLEMVPVHVVAARLGHADPAITLRVYAHALNRADDGVAELFARAVSQPTPPAAPPRTSPNVSPTPSPERPPGMTR